MDQKKFVDAPPGSGLSSGRGTDDSTFHTPLDGLDGNDSFLLPLGEQDESRGRKPSQDLNIDLPRRHGRPGRPGRPAARDPSCESCAPLIKIVSSEELAFQATAQSSAIPEITMTPLDTDNASQHRPGSCNARFQISMVHNEHGDLVEPKDLVKVQSPSDLSIVSLLRVIKKSLHHELRHRMSQIVIEEMDGKLSLAVNSEDIWKHQFSSWVFEQPSKEEPTTPSVVITPIENLPPRVLEIGCSDGKWCFQVKADYPTWIVHGVDDANHWLCAKDSIDLKDFTEIAVLQDDYFSKVPKASTDSNPQFTNRNINTLLTHPIPLPMSFYSLVRGRDIFDRIENYKTFLDSVRVLLQPGGVVEFLELDPRPRIPFIGPSLPNNQRQRTEAVTHWTKNINDRLRGPPELDIADNVPGWSGRVKERLKASSRPYSGIPATNLKTWLEGAGLYDVKESVIHVPVAGNTHSGQKMKDLILYQISLEDSIPKLKEELPKPEIEEIKSGRYHLNLHIITGRNPPFPRKGDLLSDGTRNEMTPATYSAMARFHKANSTAQWKRFDVDNEVNTILRNMGRANS